jgi:hypothetical protein
MIPATRSLSALSASMASVLVRISAPQARIFAFSSSENLRFSDSAAAASALTASAFSRITALSCSIVMVRP